jgi:class 3 adenylate cyclase/predicted negative regulator of RcsB-dependent stress response
MKSFAHWLSDIGLESYASVFAQNEIDFDVLASLTEADLQALGLPLGARKRLLQAVAKLDGQGAAEAASEPPTASATAPQAPAAAPEPSAGERRQLTVMFCDLVGSTALSERLDPEELRALLHDYRTQCGEVIKRYDGFVARYVGDGILTYFGWPKAHEEDAERSVRAALEIVQAVKRVSSTEALSVRIGIATGPVVVGEQAGEGDQAKLAVGSTPNLAARLQGLAAADQIVIAASTRRLVGNSFELSDLGEHELKGIAEPVHAWRVMTVSAAASRFEAATQGTITPLVGREQELGLLLDRWQQAQEGEGQVVLLSGEPGIGKSRVMSTLRERLAAQGAQALRFQCSPYHLNSAFYPSIDNFERALKFGRDETAESKLDKLEALIVTRYGRPLADVRFIASLLSIPYEQRYGALQMTPQKFKDETLRTLVDLTAAAAAKHPRVVLYEDAHWADPTSLEVLDLLIDRVKAMPLLIVLTHRPEFQPKWGSHGHVTALNLSKLTRAQGSAIVSKLAGGKQLPADLLEKILAKTDGVPLFVEELTKSILESGELKQAGDRYDYVGSPHDITIPATLRDSLMARLDRVMPVKEIAQMGAAIGREFSYELISAVAPMTPTQLDSALTQLTDSGLAFRRGTPPEATYTFKHVLVQDAAYDSLLKSRRQELHAKIAQVIEQRFPQIKDSEPEVLAHHYTQAGQPRSAIPLWQKAGELALARMALTESISHLNRGLDLVATLPASAERDASELALRTPLGTASMALKGWPAQEVWSALHPALALAKSLKRDDALLPVLWGLWCHMNTQGRRADALDWAKEMLDTGESSDDSDILMVGHMAAMCSYFHIGELIKAREHANQVLALYDYEKHYYLADILNLDPKTFVGVWTVHLTWMLGYPDQALKVNDAKDQHARRRGHVLDIAFAFTLGADPFYYRCEGEALHKRAEEAERLGRENSLPVIWGCLAPLRRGMALVHQSKFAEAAATLKAGLALWEAGGGRVTSPYYKYSLAEAMAHLGDLDGAIALIDDIVVTQIARPRWEERSHYAEILRLKGWMLLLKGDSEGAEKNYLASLDVAREQQAKSWELRTSTSLARLWQSQGKRKEAHDLLAPVYGWFTEGFDTKDLIDAKALLQELG